MKPSKFRPIAITCSLILLTGCITDERDGTTWVKTTSTNISNVEEERALAQNDCLAKAYELFNESPAPSNNCVGHCTDFNDGFSHAFGAGAAAGRNRQIGEARQQFYDNCMTGKGWQRQR